VPERLVCLDTSVLIKVLETEEHSDDARRLVDEAVADGARVVAPAFAWAEVGSVLRKKLRAGVLQSDDADILWRSFLILMVDYVDGPAVRARAWRVAAEYDLATLYDAAFLACTEVAPAGTEAMREFWTADAALVRQLGARKPAYVRQLGVDGVGR
jgi:predicted nucleic acid-binding protein